MPIFTCKLCNEKFYYNANRKNICSKIHQKECLICKEPFIVNSISQLVCSKTTCRNLYRKQKQIKKCRERYGVDYPFQRKDILEKTHQTTEQRYGNRVPCKNQQIQSKLEQTNLLKYGERHIFLTDKFREQQKGKVAQIKNKKDYRDFCNFVKSHSQQFTLSELAEYFNIKSLESLRIKINSKKLGNYLKDYYNLSSFEEEWVYFLENDCGISRENIELHNYKLISPKEIDICISSLQVGLEICPSYTHQRPEDVKAKTITGKQKYYHQEKTLLAKQKDIRLLTVFDWTDKNKVKEILASLDSKSTSGSLEYGIPACYNIDDIEVTEPNLQTVIYKNREYKVWDCGEWKLKGDNMK